MLMIGTLAVLVAWLVLYWLFDPDGFREPARARADRKRIAAKPGRL